MPMKSRISQNRFQRVINYLLTLSLLITTLLPLLSTPASATNNDHTVFISEIYGNDIDRSKVYTSNGDAVGSIIDLMDYIELYNDSASDMEFSTQYDLRYCEANGTPTPLAFELADAITIPANSAAVIWVKRDDLSKGVYNLPDEAAFRAAFSVPDGVPVYATKNQKALSNNANTTVQITVKDQPTQIVSTVAYRAFGKDMEGKSYHFYRQEDSTELIDYGTSNTPSAGVVEAEQKTIKPTPKPQEEELNIDPYDLFISEVYANDIDRSGAGLGVSKATDDLMDYVEVYNSSDETVSFGTYFYLELQDKNQGDFVTLTFYGAENSIVIPAGKAAIFWMKRNTASATEADFRNAFNLSDDIKVYPVEYTALGNNSSTLRLVLKSDNIVISTVTYPTFNTNPFEGKSMHYQRKEAGKSDLSVWQEFTPPTPGAIDPAQLEYVPVITDPEPEPEVDRSPLYLSEIYPDDIDRSGQGYTSSGSPLGATIDLMDYIEVYNSSDEPIDFNAAYTLTYISTDPAKPAAEKWLTVEAFDGKGTIIPAHAPAVIWIRRMDLDGKLTPFPGEAEFRAGVKMTNQDAPVFFTTNQAALSNVSAVVSLYTKAGSLASTYEYSKSLQDFSSAGTVVHLQPLEHGARMKAYLTQASATPGNVFEGQKTPFHDSGKGTELTLLDTDVTEVDEGKDLMLDYTCTDEMGVNSVMLYYRLNGEGDWIGRTSTNFAYRVEGHYFVELPGDRLLGGDYVEYYIEAFNPYRSTKTEPRTIKINRLEDFSGIRASLSEGDVLSGDVLLMGRDKGNGAVSISVDGIPLATFSRLEKGAFFALSYSGLSTGYQNAVTAVNPATGTEDVLSQIVRWFVTMPSKAILVDGSYFTTKPNGDAEITLTLRAGTQGTPFADGGGITDRDAFTATEFQLVLPNGIRLNPDNGVDPSKTYNMGGSNLEKLDLHFTIPAVQLTGAAYQWDTTKVQDGMHTVKFSASGAEETVQVRVDNTVPVLIPNMKENQLLTNELALSFDYQDASAIDEKSLVVRLDGKVLERLSINGSDLEEGEHTLTAEVSDVCGNLGLVTVHFRSAVCYPAFSSLKQDAGANSATLTAALGNHAEDTSVTFYPGKIYTIGNGVTVSQGWGDATGASKPGSLGTVFAPDGELPYQIYTVRTDGKAEDTLRVEVKGETNYGMTLRLYALDVKKNAWVPLDALQAADGVSAEFSLDGFLKSGAVQVLVQGRGTETVPDAGAPFQNTIKNDYVWDGTGEPAQYDFSIAWTSDTQYYSESYPDQYRYQSEWLVANRDRLNLRYVVHTGDVIDDFDQDWEWNVGDENMKRLEDAGIPYGVLAGNHDVGSGNRCYDYYWRYFGENRFQNSPVYGGSYQNNLGHYDLVTSDGMELLFVYMSWDVYDEEIAWVNRVLAQYPDRKAILCFHNYVVASTAELDYTGERVQREVVAINPNVIAVLNGHYHGSSINIAAFDDDGDGLKERLVYQMCTDYQSGEQGGLSYLKMLYFDLANGKVYLNSYSPYKNDFNYYDTPKLNDYPAGLKVTQQDICEWDVDFDTPERTMTTSAVTATLYGSTAIATAQAVDSSVTAMYTGLVSQTAYGWYAMAENALALKTRSEVQTFTTAGSVVSGNSGTSGSTKTETVENADGSVTRTVTNTKTGMVTATTTWPDGSLKVVETKIDGTVTTTGINKDGVKAVTVTGPEGETTSTVTLPQTVKEAVVAIPVPGATPGTVAVVVNADGMETIVRMSITIDGTVLVPLDSAATLKFVDNASTFADLPSGHWAEDAVAYVSSRELFLGTSEANFSPSMPMTRAMLVTVLYRLADMPELNGRHAFSDVAAGSWYSDAVAWASTSDIIAGTGSGFVPSGEITRESLALMLYRYAKLLGMDTSSSQSHTSFVDGSTVSAWASDAMDWAVGAGILTGKSGNRLDSTGTATRAEVAVMLMRFAISVNR